MCGVLATVAVPRSMSHWDGGIGVTLHAYGSGWRICLDQARDRAECSQGAGHSWPDLPAHFLFASMYPMGYAPIFDCRETEEFSEWLGAVDGDKSTQDRDIAKAKRLAAEYQE
jgi:hypothetical protein